MPMLFQSQAGQVVQLDDPAAQCTTGPLSVDPELDWQTYRGIITRVTVAQQVNVQFLHTMGSMVYVYVFGDRMGTVSLSGLSFFECPCDEALGITQNDVYQWYKTNRASKRKTPVKITVGEAIMQGFVIGFNEDVVDPSLNLIQWNVQMTALPDEE